MGKGKFSYKQTKTKGVGKALTGLLRKAIQKDKSYPAIPKKRNLTPLQPIIPQPGSRAGLLSRRRK